MIEPKQPDEFVVVSNGMLGYGFREESLHDAIAAGVDLIAADAGSSDPGPYYLGTGKPFVGEAMTKRDLKLLVKAGYDAGAPLIIGSAGGAGGDAQVDFLLRLLREVLTELAIQRKVAVVRTELDKAVVHEALKNQRIQTFETNNPLSPDDINQSEHIVAQMGCEAYWPALRENPDIVIGGRAWDVANIAALPLMRGYPRGLTLHMGKIVECGSLAARPTGGGDLILGRLRDDHFLVEPTHPDKACTVQSVSAHTFYEKTDPLMLAGPGGTVDLTNTIFEQIDPRRVKVTGSEFHAADPYTVKLEGARCAGHRQITIGGARDPRFIAQIDQVQESVLNKIRESQPVHVDDSQYTVTFHRYGLDGVMGKWEPAKTPAHELGVLIDVIGETPEIAEAVCGLARAAILHVAYPGRQATAGNIAFPFSPAEIDAGPVYEFNIYHLMEIDDPENFGRTEWLS
ncbi:MAG TPA: acyclic terpene utilization AtuA family protein [Alphaproteobacteria bacterium]|nr:acyclic terpene utilization AtuA family protein [Alphaproteobacteria bacterium]